MLNELGRKYRCDKVDQNFLREVVIPRIAYSSHVNDEFFEKAPFPTRRAGLEFVGQVFDENDITVEEHIRVLKNSINKKI
jgi:hypothetical protein